MASHSSTLAWRIPWTKESGRLQSMGSQSRTRLSDFTLTFHFHALEKEMATHSSILAWRIPGTEEPVGLPSMGSHRVGHDWRDLAAAAAADFPGSSAGQESPCNSGDPGFIPGSERSTGEGIGYPLQYSWASLVAQMVKNSLARWETWVQSLGWEDSLEAWQPTPVFLPGESLRTEESGRLQSMG